MKWKDTNKTLWEIRYPKMTLAQKKKTVNNNLKFTREFLCKVLSSGDELFPYGVIEVALDYERGFDDKRIKLEPKFDLRGIRLPNQTGFLMYIYII